ncbi:MAG: hypothetical protein GF390_03705 [Candidatus Pacebacteria bacterium]|nr:hypothetical protein [Candidatus Paceibacterota bacterium]
MVDSLEGKLSPKDEQELKDLALNKALRQVRSQGFFPEKKAFEKALKQAEVDLEWETLTIDQLVEIAKTAIEM